MCVCIDDLCIDDLPATYDGIAKTIWSILFGLVKQVDFVCDVYYTAIGHQLKIMK